jgi:hypothetical protein
MKFTKSTHWVSSDSSLSKTLWSHDSVVSVITLSHAELTKRRQRTCWALIPWSQQHWLVMTKTEHCWVKTRQYFLRFERKISQWNCFRLLKYFRAWISGLGEDVWYMYTYIYKPELANLLRLSFERYTCMWFLGLNWFAKWADALPCKLPNYVHSKAQSFIQISGWGTKFYLTSLVK